MASIGKTFRCIHNFGKTITLLKLDSDVNYVRILFVYARLRQLVGRSEIGKECTMSSYFHRLDKESRGRYQCKLQLSCLSIGDDPYSSTTSGEWRSVLAENRIPDIFSYFISRPGTFLKAKVNPSQRSPDLAPEAWIVAKKEGTIVCAHCTCKAG